jgi:hypothetical protein
MILTNKSLGLYRSVVDVMLVPCRPGAIGTARAWVDGAVMRSCRTYGGEHEVEIMGELIIATDPFQFADR